MRHSRALNSFEAVLALLLGLAGVIPAVPGAEEALEPGSGTLLTNVLGPVPGAETNAVEEEEALIRADRAWRSFLQIQGQLDTALLAIERTRRENEATVEVNQKKINDSLKSIEKVLQAQQEREILTLRESNRNMLIVAGAFAGVGFLTMLLTSLFHFRAMNRLAGIAASMPMGHAFGAEAAGLLSREEEHLLASGGGSGAGQRLLQAIEKLEKRVIELEHAPHVGASTGGGGVVEMGSDGNGVSSSGLEPSERSGEELEQAEGKDQMSMLLGKGQALLNLGQAEEALLCFDQALDLQPESAETLVKKGSALEKLNRLDEAIECYDQAIAMNQSMTLAYLYKGGLFNRMERYNEALACYEQALKTQQQPEALKQEWP